MKSEQVVDYAWKFAAIGLTLVWQHPIGAVKVWEAAKFDVRTGDYYKGLTVGGGLSIYWIILHLTEKWL